MIEMVGVWDTVKALGLRLPIVWQWTERPHLFHNHELGPHIRHGFQALALHETREAFSPVLWKTRPGHSGKSRGEEQRQDSEGKLRSKIGKNI